MKINYDQNWYDVMRQVIDNAVDGEYECQSSVSKGEKQYMVNAVYTIEELHFENEQNFKPMKGMVDE